MKRIVLLGMPNCGKSTLFNRLTGASAHVGNWPGVTVDLLSAKLLLGDEMVELVDLPGIYDLHGFSEDEQVVRHFLENNPVDLVLVVVNATQLDHQLGIALQMRCLHLPAVVAFNMADEAEKLGVRIDLGKMEGILQEPVVSLSAKFNRGVHESREVLTRALREAVPVPTEEIRKCFEEDDRVGHEIEKIMASAVESPSRLEYAVSEQVDRWALHPLLGIPLFLATMFLVFQAVYTLGTPLQDATAWLLGGVKALVIAPLQGLLPPLLYAFLADGLYDGIGTVASFVPIIVLFFVLMAFVEDSGYLTRAAYLLDALMSRLGLDGRSFVMLLMGFGCNVPALMGTRVMRSRVQRLLSMLIIPFSLCSARLQVFLFIATALFTPQQAPLVLFSLYLVSFAAAFLSAWLMRGRFRGDEPFVLVMPPYRVPTLSHVVLRAWREVHHFLRRATTFIVGGVVLVWLLTHFPQDAATMGETWAGALGEWFQPLMAPLGISAAMTIALIFGFVAKEVVVGALAVIFAADGDALSGAIAGQMDAVQAYSFMLFTLLYTPCLSTIATLRAESKSLPYTLFAIGWALGLAWVVSFAFYQGARALGF
ncbi:ferrous iron transport protein B [Endothiovibrio diazotrophicus]